MVPVKDRLYLNDAIMMYKCINKLAPDYLADKFVQRSHIHNRNTRSRNQLDIPRCRISTGQRSFVYRGTKLWNSLSYDVRTAKCPKVFKRRLINIFTVILIISRISCITPLQCFNYPSLNM